ncbi:MAG: HIT domain-containing protein [Rubrobacter sp.]|nr:HIT domain-containing protein [Rubrobacter sp.]
MSENGCAFCKIASGKEELEIGHEEEGMMAFRSIGGETPAHVRVIPRDHVSSPEEIGQLSEGVAKRSFEAAQAVAEKMDVAGSGYAFRINNGSDAGQEVFHLHAHVMGGRKMRMT